MQQMPARRTQQSGQPASPPRVLLRAPPLCPALPGHEATTPQTRTPWQAQDTHTHHACMPACQHASQYTPSRTQLFSQPSLQHPFFPSTPILKPNRASSIPHHTHCTCPILASSQPAPFACPLPLTHCPCLATYPFHVPSQHRCHRSHLLLHIHPSLCVLSLLLISPASRQGLPPF